MTLTQAQQHRRIEGVLDELAKLQGGLTTEDDIVRHDDDSQTIVIPADMSLIDLERTVHRIRVAQDEMVTFHRVFHYRPGDGAVCAANVMRARFGWMMAQGTQGFFTDTPPEYRTVEIGLDVKVQVPWGNIALPANFGEDAKLRFTETRLIERGVVFKVDVYVRKGRVPSIEGLFQLFEHELATNSIYRGKAITASETPEFIDVANTDPDDVVYSTSVMRQLRALVWLSVTKPEVLQARKMLTKRLTILCGRYGVGKTLALDLTALICAQHKTTFILCRAGVDDWQRAMEMARMYGGIVAFEDVDEVFKVNSGIELSHALDMIDGMQSKHHTVQVIGTTNHIDRIPKGILRFGRTDAVIMLSDLDRPNFEKLARRVVPAHELDPDIDFDAVFRACLGFTPSSVKEMLVRSVSFMEEADHAVITTDDMVEAATSMYEQLGIHESAAEGIVERTAFDDALHELVRGAVDQVVEHRIHRADIIDVEGDEMVYQIRTN